MISLYFLIIVVQDLLQNHKYLSNNIKHLPIQPLDLTLSPSVDVNTVDIIFRRRSSNVDDKNTLFILINYL